MSVCLGGLCLERGRRCPPGLSRGSCCLRLRGQWFSGRLIIATAPNICGQRGRLPAPRGAQGPQGQRMSCFSGRPTEGLLPVGTQGPRFQETPHGPAPISRGPAAWTDGGVRPAPSWACSVINSTGHYLVLDLRGAEPQPGSGRALSSCSPNSADRPRQSLTGPCRSPLRSEEVLPRQRHASPCARLPRSDPFPRPLLQGKNEKAGPRELARQTMSVLCE